MIEDITLEPIGVAHLHLISQECPPKSGRVPDGSKIYLSHLKDINNQIVSSLQNKSIDALKITD